MLGHAARGSQCEGPTRSNGANAVVGLDNVSVTRDYESALRIGNDEKRLEVAQRAVLAPFLGELDSRLGQVAMMLLKLALETFK